jgi:hypothetical protein
MFSHQGRDTGVGIFSKRIMINQKRNPEGGDQEDKNYKGQKKLFRPPRKSYPAGTKIRIQKGEENQQERNKRDRIMELEVPKGGKIVFKP